MPYCKHCGQPIDPEAVVCVRCGVAANQGTAFCRNCGQPVTPGATFCTQCGAAMTPPVVQGEQKSKLGAGLLGIFLGSLGIHNFYLGFTKKSRGATADLRAQLRHTGDRLRDLGFDRGDHDPRRIDRRRCQWCSSERLIKTSAFIDKRYRKVYTFSRI